MKTCPSCSELYNLSAQFYSTGEQEVCGACHDDWEDEQKEKAEEKASLAGLECPDEADASACPRCQGSGQYNWEHCGVCDGSGKIVPDDADEASAPEGAFDVSAAIASLSREQLGKLLAI